MQSDARLVKDIENADQSRSDLRGKSDSLRLTPREGPRLAGKGQIFKPDRLKKAEPCADLL